MYEYLPLIYILALSATVSASPCPAKCTCNEREFTCINATLSHLPDNISSSVAYIDLSYNPHMQFSQDYFTKFKRLQTLHLKGCSIKQPVLLPESIISIELSYNQLNIKSITEMFSRGNWTRLRVVLLKSNKINGTGFFTEFPRGITELILAGNHIPRIGKEDLKGFRHLRHLDISNCGLTEIEAGGFDSLKELMMLKMSVNKLVKLPSRLFQFTVHLTTLYINRNNLTAVPDLQGIEYLITLAIQRNKLTSVVSKDIAVKKFQKILLNGNKIQSFNLNGTSYIHLDLSRNYIKRIDDYSFVNQSAPGKDVKYILLQDNNIAYIAPKAFAGINSIGELFLQRSNITFLPEGLFQGMSIRRLYLFGNNLNHTKGLLKGMQKTPEMVLLFGNPNISSFRASDFQNMGKGSAIFTGCKNLEMIESGHNLMAAVICSPSKELVVITELRALQGDGFRCKKKKISGLFTCTPCPVGTWEYCNTEICNGLCLNCPAGSFYQDEMASVQCKWCPPGQFVPPYSAPGKRAIDCLTCPKNTNTNDTAGYRACPCLSGHARTERFGPCEKCTQEGIQCVEDYRDLVQGYWMTWESIKTPSNESCEKLYKAFIKNLQTKNDTYDRLHVNFTGCRMPLPQKCPITRSCPGGVGADCALGYKGPLCAVCSDGFMKQFARCRKCPPQGVAIAQSVGYILSFLFICLLISATDKIELADDDAQGDDTNKNGNKRTFADIILSSLKILMGFYQVVSGLIHALSYINWPHSLKSVMSSFEFIQFEILRIPSLHCIKSQWRLNAVKEFWLALIATFAVPLIIFAYFATRSLFFLCTSVGITEFKNKVRDCAKHSLRAVILFLFASYPLTCTRIVQILPISCHRLCTVMDKQRCLRDVYYLRSDYSVDCNIELSTSLLKAAYAALAIPIGFPVALFLLLLRYSPHRTEVSRSSDHQLLVSGIDHDSHPYVNAELLDDDGGRSKDDGIVRFAMRFAFENYNRKCWYWEVVEMIRKLLMTVGIVFFLHHTKIGLAGIITIATLFTMAQAAMNPITDNFENFLQLLSLTIVPINLSIGAIIQSNDIQDDDIINKREDSVGMGIILIFLNSLLIALVSFRFIRVIIKKIISVKKKKKNR